MADSPAPHAGTAGGGAVGEVAALYLGNILYALERCAMALDAEDKAMDAAFYRGIGRKLVQATAPERSA